MVDHYVTHAPGARGSKEARTRIERGTVELKGGKIVRVEVDIVVVGNTARARIERAPVLGHLRPILPDGRHHHPLSQ
jgi:hypothetical protein